jgi:ATP-dependent Clp protease, protease subunit
MRVPMVPSAASSFPPPEFPPFPGVPPEFPPFPGVPPEFPPGPGSPRPAVPPRPVPPVVTPAQLCPERSPWPGQVYERLFERRIVLAHGELDEEAATSLCAQLLTLDAERNEPIRLEIQGLTAQLGAALTVIGVLDVVRVPVRAYAGGQVSGPALGVLAAAAERRAYPNAMLVLSEPRLGFQGSATSLSSCEEQVRVMLDALYLLLADVTGREVDEIRADARRGRYFTVDEAIGYGLIQEPAGRRGSVPRR